MLRRMRPGLFDEWMAFDRIEPIGLERLIDVLTRGFYALAQKGIDPFGPTLKPEHIDPLLKSKRGASARQTPDEQRAAIRQIASIHNAGVR